ncbi:MAG: acetate--CoA ligase family protein [Desulfobacteraceae bacterium]|nr:acetate--CoA ligase family protein [Desulfobacteraceae bacterium]
MNPRGGDLFGQKMYAGIDANPHSIDLNPVVSSAEKCVVADARIMLPEVKESTNI